MLPIPTRIRFANFKSLSEDIKGRKLFKLGNYVFLHFISAQCLQSATAGININVVGAFCLLTGNAHLDLKPIEFVGGLSIAGSSSDTLELH